MLETLRNSIIVSCQPVPGGAMDDPSITAAFALAALDGGARGLRIQGCADLAAVRAVTDVPIIGLIKRDRDDTAVRITPTLDDVANVARAGADIIAFDATQRSRPVTVAALVAAIQAQGKLALADCATYADAVAAVNEGADMIATTLAGYTGGPVPHDPDYQLLTAMRTLGRFTLAEGRYHSPELAARAHALGADAVVVGSAVTRPEHITSWYVSALAGAPEAGARYG